MKRSGHRKGARRRCTWRLSWLVVAVCGLVAGRDARAEEAAPPAEEPKPAQASDAAAKNRENTDESPKHGPEIPRFAINSPFGKPYKSPVPKAGKRLWAASRLWQKSPELVVEKWLGPEPGCEGKFLLIEFWATWCRQCRLAVPKLNAFQRRFADDLVVIGISDEGEATVRGMTGPRIEFPLAIDTKARMKTELAVKGIPHVIVVAPGGAVVWEGFPLLKDHELTEEVLEALIIAGRGRTSRKKPAERTSPGQPGGRGQFPTNH